jgi:hypothetical protein
MSARAMRRGVPWVLLLVAVAALVIGILLIMQSGPHVVGYWRHALPASVPGHEKPGSSSTTTSPSVIDYVGFAASMVSLLGAVSTGGRFLFRLVQRRPS